MFSKRKEEMILYIIAICCVSQVLSGGSVSCTFKAWSGDGHQSLLQLEMRACPSSTEEAESPIKSRGPNRVAVENLQAYWSPYDSNKWRLLLNITMIALGQGEIDITVLSSGYVLPFFCGIITKGPQANESDQIWAQLKCLEKDMSLEDSMSLVAEPRRPSLKRNTPARVTVDLPGCTLPEFQNTRLCRQKREKKIKFSLKREGTATRPILKVILSRNVYKSQFEPRSVTRTRRYFVLIHEKGDKFAVRGNRETQEITYPKRHVRFRYIKPKTTYVVIVWRRGEGTRFKREVTVC